MTLKRVYNPTCEHGKQWTSKFELRGKRKQAQKRVNRWLRRFCYR